MASVKGVYAGKGVGHSPTFHTLLHQASAGCHCVLAVESMISSNMTIGLSAFYRTQKLRFNVSQTYLCLITRNRIGLRVPSGGSRVGKSGHAPPHRNWQWSLAPLR